MTPRRLIMMRRIESFPTGCCSVRHQTRKARLPSRIIFRPAQRMWRVRYKASFTEMTGIITRKKEIMTSTVMLIGQQSVWMAEQMNIML